MTLLRTVSDWQVEQLAQRYVNERSQLERDPDNEELMQEIQRICSELVIFHPYAAERILQAVAAHRGLQPEKVTVAATRPVCD